MYVGFILYVGVKLVSTMALKPRGEKWKCTLLRLLCRIVIMSFKDILRYIKDLYNKF